MDENAWHKILRVKKSERAMINTFLGLIIIFLKSLINMRMNTTGSKSDP